MLRQLGAKHLQVHHRRVAALGEFAVESRTYAIPPDIPAAKFLPVAPQDDDGAAGHVFAAVVADAFDTARAPELRTAKRSPATPRK